MYDCVCVCTTGYLLHYLLQSRYGRTIGRHRPICAIEEHHARIPRYGMADIAPITKPLVFTRGLHGCLVHDNSIAVRSNGPIIVLPLYRLNAGIVP